MTAALPATTSWRPLTVTECASVMRATTARWWIAGGWAIDLFLGEQTRDHGDIDIAMLRGDERALLAVGADFDFCIPHEGAFTPWAGEPLADDHHQFWARRRGDDAWAFEVLLERHHDAQWEFRRDSRITLPLERFGQSTRDGVPYVAPEIALLYKAKHDDLDRNAADFARALPRLEGEARSWLRDALAVTDAGHPWLALL